MSSNIDATDIPTALNNLFYTANVSNISRGSVLDTLEFFLYDRAAIQETRVYGYTVYRNMHTFISPLIFCIGIIGNILSIIVLRNKRMNNLSISLVLTVLSVTDMIVLTVGLAPEWIGLVFDFDIKVKSSILCKLIHFILYSSSEISAWLIVAVTVERYFIVCRPLLVPSVCRKSRAIKYIILIIFILCLVNLHNFWTVDIIYEKWRGVYTCSDTVVNDIGEHFLLWIDAALFAFLPTLILIIFNALILKHIANGEALLVTMKITPARNKFYYVRLSFVLMMVSCTYILSTIPISVVVILTVTWKSNPAINRILSSIWIARAVAELAMYVNHSINFILYSLSGEKFRMTIYAMVRKKQRRRQQLRQIIELQSLALTEIGGSFKRRGRNSIY